MQIERYGNRESVGGGIIEAVGRLTSAIGPEYIPPNPPQATINSLGGAGINQINGKGTLLKAVENIFKHL